METPVDVQLSLKPVLKDCVFYNIMMLDDLAINQHAGRWVYLVRGPYRSKTRL